MKTRFAKSCLYSFALVLVMGFASNASALTITPARVELSGDPGTTITGSFTVTNEQDQDKTFYSTSENFESSGETGTPSFIASKEGLASWINTASEVSLKKGEERKVSFTITIPKDADAGGHFAAIFLNTAPPNAEKGQVSVGAKIGVLILLRVSGEIKEGGGITDFSTKDKGFFFTSLPVDFAYRFNNSGNDRANPTGEVVIRDTFGLKAATISANPNQGNVLPGSTRRFDVIWGPNIARPGGFFAASLFELRNFAFGFYKAKVDLIYGQNGSASASKIIFVFPWQLLLIVLIILSLIWFVLKKLIRKYNRFIISKASQGSL